MAVPIDQLQIEIQARSNNAANGVEALASSLVKLKRAVNVKGAERLKTNLAGIQAAISQISPDSGTKLSQLAAGLTALANIPKQKIGATTASQISTIGVAAQSLVGADFSAFSQMATGLSALASVGKSTLTATVANNIRAVGDAVRSLVGTDFGFIQALVDGLKPLGEIGKSNLGSALNQLKKIPEITKGLDPSTLSDFAAKIVQVTDAVRPLATEMEKVSAGFSKLPANIQRAISANARLTSSNYRVSNSFFKLSTIMAKVYAIKRIANVIGGWIDESNRYVEDLNLFYVTMGKYADEAKRYAEKVGDLFGLDPREFMRYQGIFQNMVTGFGVASDKAAIMSKNLTQLGYDLASVFNVKFEVAMEKLQSAISGQPRPMREWGFDMSEATLKAVALGKGIEKNVETMTQLEKSQLRYVQLLETAQKLNLTGDLSRTLSAPANQLRILAANATQAARALGNIFIPALNAVLPYAIAFLKVVRTVAQEIASLFGFTLPEIDYSGLGEIGAELEEGTEQAKEFKKSLMGFDEINILHDKGTGTQGIGPGIDIELPEYDFFGVIDSRIDEITEKIHRFFEDWGGTIEVIGGALLTAFTAKALLTGISNLGASLKTLKELHLDGLVKAVVGVGGLITAFFGAKSGAEQLAVFLATGEGSLASAITSLVVGGAGAVVAGMAIGGPIGWALAGIVLLTGALIGVKDAIDQMNFAQAMDEMFGSITITEEQAKMLAEKLLERDWVVAVQLALDEHKTMENIKAGIESLSSDIARTMFRLSLGYTLDKEGFESFLSDTKSMVEKAQAYVDSQEYAIELALRATFDTESDAYHLISGSNLSVSAAMRSDLERLGSELSDVLTKAYEDNLFDIDELSKAKEIMDQIATITNIVMESQDIALLETLRMKWSGKDLDYESYKLLLQEMKAYSVERGKDVETLITNTTASLQSQVMFSEMELAKDPSNVAMQKLYNDAQAAYTEYITSNPLQLKMAEIELDVSRFVFNTLGATGLAELAPEDILGVKVWGAPYLRAFTEGYQDSLGVNFSGIDPFTEMGMNDYIKSLSEIDWDKAVELSKVPDVAKAVRAGIADAFWAEYVTMSNQLKNFIEAFLKEGALASTDKVKQMQELIALGQAVPQTLVDEITSFQSVSALTNASDALWYMAGQNYATMPGFLQTLETVKLTAEELPEMAALGMLSNISSIKHAGNQVFFELKDGTLIALDAMSEATKHNLELMGIDWAKMTSYIGSDTIEGMTYEIDKGITEIKKTLDKLDKIVPDAVKKAFAPTPLRRIITQSLDGLKFEPMIELSKGGNVIMTLSAYAAGGFPSAGEMFIARESGPEMVGTMGGRTAVANNDQIVDGIAAGVARAMRENQGNGGPATAYVVVDGAVVGEAVFAHHNDLVRQTGRSPLAV